MLAVIEGLGTRLHTPLVRSIDDPGSVCAKLEHMDLSQTAWEIYIIVRH